MARATSTPQDRPDQHDEDMLFIAVPLDTYRAFGKAAAERGLTFASALQLAFNDFINGKKE